MDTDNRSDIAIIGEALKHRKKQKRLSRFEKQDLTGWDKKSDYHYRKVETSAQHGGKTIDWWPSTGKHAINGVMQKTKLTILKEDAE